jgi:NDP-sugar pyrophosphorylase family protein
MSLPRALILTAGLGTRLRPLTYIRAKAAVPVNGETLVRRVVLWLAGQGVNDLILNLHHHPQSIAASVGDGSDLGARVRYSWEQPVLGSAGGPRRALPLLVGPEWRSASAPGPGLPLAGQDSRIAHSESRTIAGTASDTFIIVNGDTLTDVDLPAMLKHHAQSGAMVTMAVIPNPMPGKYGGVVVAQDNRITGFTRAGTAPLTYHFIGVQIVERRAFSDLEDGVPVESVNRLYPRLMAAEPGSVVAFVCDAAFCDIGTPADYLRTSVELAAAEGDRLTAGRNVQIAPSAALTRTALWDDVVVGANAVLVDCIVADNARVPAGARYEQCAIVPAGTRKPADGERIENGLLIKKIALPADKTESPHR